jgi:putative membrane protein
MVDVATEDSLNHSMNSALKHYSSMFFLPAFQKAVAAVAGICICGVSLSTFALTLQLPSLSLADGLLRSLFLGVSVFAAVLFADYVISKIVLRRDPIYVLRRTVALSLFCWVLWMLFLILGVAFGAFFGWLWWVKLCLLGFAAVTTFRAVVFIATSSVGFLQRLLSSLFSPLLCIAPFMVFWASINSALPLQFLPFLVISTIAGSCFAFLFVFLVDQVGQRTYGVPSMPLFRAFMLNWVAALNAPFEALLEQLGANEDIEVTLLKFNSYKPKAAIIVPLVHPGPFKNIGSSLLPSLLKRDFEKEFGCDTCVPLGILGHELDLASQAQNQKIIAHVIDSARFPASAEKATPFVKVTEGFVTALCQVFGKHAFLSFTLAPKTTEDLPQELGRIVNEEAEKLGLDCSIVVNAHNSINDTVDLEATIDTLREVASQCLKKAVSLPSYAFEVGASTVFPKEFRLEDGMGLGGITAVVVNVAEQKTVYVVIDGNNMVSGLREEILSALKATGFHESEVFTTDTHAVSAVVLGRRGYHPVGEAMNHETLISYIKEAAQAAAANLESCKAGCLRLVVPNVRVIGEARLASLSLLVDKALRWAKQIVAPIFVSEGLLLILLLALL